MPCAASTVDLEEAYRSGQLAAILAATGQSGHMATILRNPGPIYNVRYDKVPLDEVANSERTFPAKWIAASGCDVTDEFVRYAKPLVGEDMLTIPLVDGRFRMTRFEPKYATQKLAKYVPQADRKNWLLARSQIIKNALRYDSPKVQCSKLRRARFSGRYDPTAARLTRWK
jgi:6-phosphofructokinase 1